MALQGNDLCMEITSEDYGEDNIWRKDGDWYERTTGTTKYRSTFDGNKFLGGTSNFGIYGNSDDFNFLYILAYMTKMEQFVNLLFSSSDLANLFLEWFYRKIIVQSNASASRLGEGEHYLYKNNSRFVEKLGSSQSSLASQFTGTYQIASNNVPEKFRSIKELVNSPGSTLTQYCKELNDIVNETSGYGLNWLTDKSNREVCGWIYDNFKTEWADEGKYKTTTSQLVDNLLKAYPILEYFRNCLQWRLEADFSSFDNFIKPGTAPTTEITSGAVESVVDSVKKYIKGKLTTALVLGGYDDGTYPGLDNYMYKNQRSLLRSQVIDVMSLTNLVNEVVAGIQSTDFFSKYGTFNELSNASSNASSNLFEMKQNEDFVALSKLVLPSSDDKTLDVDWSAISTWLF
jgi:hypothetical protein